MTPPDDMVALYRSGLSVVKIAPRFGFSPSTILRRLDMVGVPRRRPGRPAEAAPTPRMREAHALREQGLSYAKIGRRMGISEGRACELCTRFKALSSHAEKVPPVGFSA